ncbi:hypothetical protein [Desulfosporosinus sp. FKA]|nr:hypothetical protein [Desulfosporosinus sp. FKA]
MKDVCDERIKGDLLSASKIDESKPSAAMIVGGSLTSDIKLT